MFINRGLVEEIMDENEQNMYIMISPNPQNTLKTNKPRSKTL